MPIYPSAYIAGANVASRNFARLGVFGILLTQFTPLLIQTRMKNHVSICCESPYS